MTRNQAMSILNRLAHRVSNIELRNVAESLVDIIEQRGYDIAQFQNEIEESVMESICSGIVVRHKNRPKILRRAMRLIVEGDLSAEHIGEFLQFCGAFSKYKGTLSVKEKQDAQSGDSKRSKKAAEKFVKMQKHLRDFDYSNVSEDLKVAFRHLDINLKHTLTDDYVFNALGTETKFTPGTTLETGSSLSEKAELEFFAFEKFKHLLTRDQRAFYEETRFGVKLPKGSLDSESFSEFRRCISTKPTSCEGDTPTVVQRLQTDRATSSAETVQSYVKRVLNMRTISQDEKEYRRILSRWHRGDGAMKTNVHKKSTKSIEFDSEELTVVPKNANIDRIIMTQSFSRMVYSMRYFALWELIKVEGLSFKYGYVKKLDLKDQLPSRNQGIRGSKDLHNDRNDNIHPVFGFTLDLSSASDTISRRFMSTFLPFLTNILDCCSSKKSKLGMKLSGFSEIFRDFKVSEDEYEFELFTGMGSTFCFPLQSIIFTTVLDTAICRHVPAKVRNRVRNELVVYGDDIILATNLVSKDIIDRIFTSSIQMLESCGFVVNRTKSCSPSSPFMEVCGVIAYKGFDIRSVRIKEPITSSTLKSTVDLANAFSRRGYFSVSREICNILVSDFPRLVKRNIAMVDPRLGVPGLILNELPDFYNIGKDFSQEKVVLMSLRDYFDQYSKRILSPILEELDESPFAEVRWFYYKPSSTQKSWHDRVRVSPDTFTIFSHVPYMIESAHVLHKGKYVKASERAQAVYFMKKIDGSVKQSGKCSIVKKVKSNLHPIYGLNLEKEQLTEFCTASHPDLDPRWMLYMLI